MKTLILSLSIWIISITYSQEDKWYSKSSTNWNSLFHQMKFRQPVIFTPFEIKMGYLNYGGNSYWLDKPFNSNPINPSDLPVILDSTQYNFNVINNVKNRTGQFIEVDILKINLPNYIVKQNYFDIQFGLGLQYTSFSPETILPSEKGIKWDINSTRGNYFYNPKSTGINFNTSISYQMFSKNSSYFYHSIGLSSLSIYESEGGDKNLTGTGLSESFGLGTKFIFYQPNSNFSYTLGLEARWSRLYINAVDAPINLSPIKGLDLKASGVFLTTGIQFGGKQTDGDIAYNYMINNDFLQASEFFEEFLAKNRDHGKRKKALKMLQFCKSQIPYQQVNLGLEKFKETKLSEAIDWLNLANKEATNDLKKNINNEKISIVNTIIDSVETNKHIMSISDAEELISIALELMPENKKAQQIISGIYINKAQLNSSIGNFSESIKNYEKSISYYPPIEELVLAELDKLINLIIEDALAAYTTNEIYLVIKSLKMIIDLKPSLSKEWDNYIQKLELKLEQNDIVNSNYSEKYINEQKQAIFKNKVNKIQLGMTYKEVEKINGTPFIIDEITESNQHFQMWTYKSQSKKSYLYFQNNKLIRIDEEL